jgi:hypothetical protein
MPMSFLTPEHAAQHPELRALLDVDSLVITDYIPSFQALLRSNFVEELVATTLRGIGTYTLDLDASTDDSEWRLLLTDRFSLRLGKVPRIPDPQGGRRPDGVPAPAGRTLAALPNDILMGVKGHGTLTANFYRSAFDRDQDVFTKEHRIELIEQRRLAAGDYVLLRASQDVIEFVESDGGVITLDLALTKANTIVWNYDPDTLRALFASSGSVNATRMEFTIELFRVFKDRQAIPNLLRIVKEHEFHWIRWEAVKALLHIDLDSGKHALDVASLDSHRHVRAAAAKTLVNLRAASLIA